MAVFELHLSNGSVMNVPPEYVEQVYTALSQRVPATITNDKHELVFYIDTRAVEAACWNYDDAPVE